MFKDHGWNAGYWRAVGFGLGDAGLLIEAHRSQDALNLSGEPVLIDLQCDDVENHGERDRDQEAAGRTTVVVDPFRVHAAY